MRVLAAAVLLAGCGHLGFDPAGDGAPAASDCPAFATFCDGFESGDYSKWPMHDISQGGSLTVQTANVHGGHYALDATMPALFDGALAAVELPVTPQTTGTFALREWVYAPQQLAGFDAVAVLWDGKKFINVAVDDFHHWDASDYPGSGAVIDHGSSVAAVPGVWTCIEIDVAVGASFQLFVDDASAIALPLDDPSIQISLVWAGLPRADAAGARVIVDDVVIAPQHIGCS